MCAKLVFAKRSQEQIEIFGGEVFADVDGKQIATIGTRNITYEIPAGTHTVRMYKSHSYGSMIGFADNTFTIAEDEALVFKYFPPMKTTQPGHITVSKFTSYDDIDSEVETMGRKIGREKAETDRVEKETQEKIEKNQRLWWIWIIIVPAIIWVIYEIVIMNSIYSHF